MTRFVEQYIGCIVGLACGDALARETEFASLAEIRARFGPEGITDLPEPAFYTDDTAMTRALAEGLLDAGAGTNPDVAMPHVARRFVEWLHSDQTHRAPGTTCMAGCRALDAGVPWQQSGVKGSKGCGAAMRVAPVGLLYRDHAVLREIAYATAVCTHDHPAALASAHAAALVVRLLLEGVQPTDLVSCLQAETSRQSEEWGRVLGAVPLGLEATRGGVDPADVLQRGKEPWRLGEGWVADEAVASALYCFLLAHERGGGYELAVRLAANTQGDSDSLACLAGGFGGVHWGLEAIPEDWRRRVEDSAELHDLGRRLFEAAGRRR